MAEGTAELGEEYMPPCEAEGEASEGEEERGCGEEGERGPRDVIKVRVLAYHKTEEDFFYNIEVGYHHGNVDGCHDNHRWW